MRESNQLEFKEKVTNTFLKTVVAFSNYYGGKIIFGVNDFGESIGIKNINESIIKVEHMINDSISPQVDYYIETDNIKNIFTLNVSPGIETPYFYKSKTFRRNDTSTIEVDKNELKRLILKGNNKTFDALMSKSTENSYVYLGEKFEDILKIQSIDTDVLKSLQLIDKNSNPTNAGNLFSDKNEYKILDIIRFGKNQDIIINRYRIEDCSLLEAFDKCIEIYRENYVIEQIEGAYRKEVELVPEKAFREALANSLVHREWIIDSFIQISMEDEWISITSPGSLPDEISEKEFLEGRLSYMRNPIIGNIFFRLDIIESFGTGIKRIINSYSKSHKKPIFNIFNNSVEIKLPVMSKADKLTNDQRKIFMALENKELASSEISDITEFGKNKVLNIIESLIESGYVRRIGRGRGTRYTTNI